MTTTNSACYPICCTDKNFPGTLWLLSSLMVSVVAGFSYYHIHESLIQNEVLVTNYAESVASVDILEKDVSYLSRDIGRFSETLLASHLPPVRIQIWMNDSLVGTAGPDRDLGMFSDKVERSLKLKNGADLKINFEFGTLSYILNALLLLIVLEGCLFFFVRQLFKKVAASTIKMTQPLVRTAALVSQISQNLEWMTEAPSPSANTNVIEIKILDEAVGILVSEIIKLKKNLAETNFEMGRAQTLKYVAHNVLGPIATLEMASKHFNGLSQQDRTIIDQTIRRVRETAEGAIPSKRTSASSLEPEKKHNTALNADQLNPRTLTEIYDVIQSVAEEKKLLYIERAGLSFYFKSPRSLLFCMISPVQFSAIISNLIDNAAEAIEEVGEIEVVIEDSNDHVRVCVSDNGIGIPVDILPELKKPGRTFGKKSGSGFGLSHADEYVRAWGGKLDILSNNGMTHAILELPLMNSSAHIAASLNLRSTTTVVIADDDELIHQAWNLKLKEFPNLIRKHFYTPDELIAWVSENDGRFEDRVYLVDFDFAGHPITGTELIERLKIGLESYLVTGLFSDARIISRVNELGLIQIPKPYLASMPIVIEKSQSFLHEINT